MRRFNSGCLVVVVPLVAIVAIGLSFVFPNLLVPPTPASEEPYSRSNPMPINAPDTGNSLFVLAGIGSIVLVVIATIGIATLTPTQGKIRNEIVGHHQRTHALLIRADNIRQIEGYAKNVDGNLPGNIFSTGQKGLYLLDRYQQYDVRTSKERIVLSENGWERVSGYMIVPRGEAVRNNVVRDQMDGYKYEYIWKIEDWENFERD